MTSEVIKREPPDYSDPEIREQMDREFGEFWEGIMAQVCARCGMERRYAMHSRRYGYMCQCGSQEWRKATDEMD